jgi:hypothetical protein
MGQRWHNQYLEGSSVVKDVMMVTNFMWVTVNGERNNEI